MVENFPTCESNLDASSAMISPLSLELTCSTLTYNYLRLKRDRTPFDETTPRSPGWNGLNWISAILDDESILLICPPYFPGFRHSTKPTPFPKQVNKPLKANNTALGKPHKDKGKHTHKLEWQTQDRSTEIAKERLTGDYRARKLCAGYRRIISFQRVMWRLLLGEVLWMCLEALTGPGAGFCILRERSDWTAAFPRERGQGQGRGRDGALDLAI